MTNPIRTLKASTPTCRICRGDGKLRVGPGRGELKSCPTCRGTGRSSA